MVGAGLVRENRVDRLAANGAGRGAVFGGCGQGELEFVGKRVFSFEGKAVAGMRSGGVFKKRAALVASQQQRSRLPTCASDPWQAVPATSHAITRLPIFARF